MWRSPMIRLLPSLALTLALASRASAVMVPFTGTLTVQIGGAAEFVQNLLPAYVRLDVAGSGIATISVSPGGAVTRLTLPSGAFSGSATNPVPNQFPIVRGLIQAANGPIVLASGGICTAGHP